MDNKRARTTPNDQACVACPRCGGKQIISNVSERYGFAQSFTARCRCGHSFPLIFERRLLFRTVIALPGHYEGPGTRGAIMVQDLSLGGICFQTLEQHAIEVDSHLTVTYTTRPPDEEHICRTVIVKRVQGPIIGALFTDTMPPADSPTEADET